MNRDCTVVFTVTELFDARTKYDSHTGWPSFWQPIAPENVHEVADNEFGMNRTEVQCSLWDSALNF